jgi:tRNA isopentenyl-2-thiomethyl-A-37 hydroxylase MiaE
MTAAQKKVAANFKKALAIRKATGCSLKDAFAKVYGKKTAVKKAAPKKVARKKSVGKKIGAYVSSESMERMDQLTSQNELFKFKQSVINIVQNLYTEEGFELDEINEYIKLRLKFIYQDIK